MTAVKSRRILILFLVLGCIGVLLFLYTHFTHDTVAGHLSDDVIYLLQAEAYSPWTTEKPPVLLHVLRISQFPPLFPFILGITNPFPANLAVANWINLALLMASIIVYTVWLYKDSGSMLVAFCLGMLFSVLPSTILNAQDIWSEHLYMLFQFTVFIFLTRKIDKPSVQILVALLIGLASLTRTVGITLILAYIVTLVRQSNRLNILYVAICALPILSWTLLNKVWNQRDGYTSIMIDLYKNLDLTEFVLQQLVYIWGAWVWTFSPVTPIQYPAIFIFLACFLILVLIGFISRLQERRFDALYLLIMVLVILLWPFQGVSYMSRFLFPVIPLFFYYAWCALKILAPKVRISSRSVFLVVLFMICSYSSLLHISLRLFESVPEELQPYTKSRRYLLAADAETATKRAAFDKLLTDSLKRLSHLVPHDQCVYSVHPQTILYYMRRISYRLPGPFTTASVFVLDTSYCNYIVAMHVKTGLFNYPLLYPQSRIASDKRWQILARLKLPAPNEKALITLFKKIN